MIRTITYNGVDFYKAFGFIVDTVTKQPPSKKENRQSVPYKSGTYNMYSKLDYSLFEDRELVYIGQLILDDSTDLDRLLTKINSIVMSPSGDKVLQDNFNPEYHYLLEGQSVALADNERGYGELTITFKGYPFKIWNKGIHDVKWDEINFELDEFQPDSFSVVQGKTFTVNNTSPEFVPFKYTASADFDVTIDGNAYHFSKGTYTAGYKLKPGKNVFNVVNTNSVSSITVSFDWYRREL